MKEDQLTPWFPAEVKPVHVGPYPTKLTNRDSGGFSWWDGSGWSVQFFWLDDCCSHKNKFYRNQANQNKQWRGLRSKP